MKEKTIKDPIQMVEAEIHKMLDILKNGSTNELKKKARKEILRLEKHMRDKQDEYYNGHKYPVREVPPKVSKKELLDLIESGYPEEEWRGRTVTLTDDWDKDTLNLMGLRQKDIG